MSPCYLARNLLQGNTKVLAAVYGPREARNRGGGGQSEAAVVNCQYSMAVFRQGSLSIKFKSGSMVLLAWSYF